jgi:tetratricopeptide (TPR) repeat protein
MGRLSSQIAAIATAVALASAALPARLALAQETVAPSASADAQARQLYLEGDEAYAAGDYELAVARFARAYELSGRPALLFNLGNAYERMGAFKEAAEALRRYLEGPDARDREAVELRIARLEEAHRRRQAEIARLEALAREQAGDDLEPASGHGEIIDDAAPATRDTRTQAWLGGGGAAVAGGLMFGLVSHLSGNQAVKRCTDDGSDRLCPDSARSALSRERGFAIAADVTIVLGLGAAGVGAYRMWKERRGEVARGLTLAPTVLSDGLGVGVRGGF